MKICFLVNPAPQLIEFFGKLAREVAQKGDEYIVVVNSKIAEYEKMKYFPKDVKFFSEVDWCLKNYKKDQKEFPGLFWKELFAEFERFNGLKLYNFNYQNSTEIIAQSYQFADFIFQKEKPDIIVAEPPTSTFNEVFYFFCQKYDKTYLGFIVSRLEGRFDIYNLKHTCTEYEAAFKTLNENNISGKEKSFARDFVKQFISHKQIPPYMVDEFRHLRSGELNRLKGYLKREKKMLSHYLKYLSKRKYFHPFDYNSEFLLNHIPRYPLHALRNRFRTINQKNIFDSLGDNDKFFLYPLHFQPESSTSVQAMYFCDQLNSIKNIAFSLPFPCKLYVKEHPSAIGTKPGSFYRKIKEIPNVVLISPYENVENLIKKSEGIVTLTSTIGMEAVLSGKPVYVLGDVFYDYHPLCRKVNGFEELRKKIQEDIINKPVVVNLENINIRFIVSYFKNTIAGNIVAASSKNDTNDYRAIYKDIKRIFSEAKN